MNWRRPDVALRTAMGVTFLFPVADRFGIWGPPGAPNVGWGDFKHFLAYTAHVNSFAPAWSIPILGWAATTAELVFGICLLIGFRPMWAAYGSAVLLLLFALAMTISLGVKEPLDYSVWVDAAGMWFLAEFLRRKALNAI